MYRYSEPKRVWYRYIRTITTPIPIKPVEKTRNVLSKLEGLPCRAVVKIYKNRKATTTKTGTRKTNGPAKARCLISFVLGAPDCLAASSRL